MAAGLIPAGFTGRPVVRPLAHGDARTVTLLGRVDEANPRTTAGVDDDPQAPPSPSAARRGEFLAGRTLVRLAVAELTGAPVDEVRIGTRGGGRPICLSAREVDVSISHSAGRIAVTAAHGCEVGIDIQIPVPVSAGLLLRYGVAGSGTVPPTAPVHRRDPAAPAADPGWPAADPGWPAPDRGVPAPEPGDDQRRARTADAFHAFADAWTVREACAKTLGLRVGADLWRIPVPPRARRGDWEGAHWYRLPPFQGCPVALALRPRSRGAGPRSRQSDARPLAPAPPKNRRSTNRPP
ncbi:4'-phosphopantetheinyl transferase family protein [Streptomyces sp. NPDC055051]